MKIGILTFHASHNYGSMLQAYALQHYLMKQGHDVEIINLRIKEQKELYGFPLIPPLHFGRKAYIRRLAKPRDMYHACHKWFKFERFLKENLRLTDKEYGNWEEVVADIPQLGYQCIITGSDQIWNMHEVCRDFTEAYYLPSELPDVRKVAYAPSFGSGVFLDGITHEQEMFIKNCLSSYDYISVRETAMQSYLTKLLDREIEMVVDPALLLCGKDYETFVDKKTIVEGDYIFYYTPSYLGIGPEWERFAVKLGQHYGLKVVTSFSQVDDNRSMDTVPEAGPAEFLNLLKNAKMIVGRSFHLVAFSLLFHKNFISIDGDNDERMKSLLYRLHIPERGQVTENNYKTINLPDIDYDCTDILIDNMRKHSEAYLKRALTSTV